jgi:hypothetical protein
VVTKRLTEVQRSWILQRLLGCTCPPSWYNQAEAAAWLFRNEDTFSCPLHERVGELNAQVGEAWTKTL